MIGIDPKYFGADQRYHQQQNGRIYPPLQKRLGDKVEARGEY